MVDNAADVALVGTLSSRNDYCGARTFYLSKIFEKHMPELRVQVYDVCEQDVSKRCTIEGAKNVIFLPWSEAIDIGWIDFLSNLGQSFKILYTEDHYWYQQQKDRVLKLGFNLENLFNVISFSTRNGNSWWRDEKQYFYWGPAIYTDFFADRVVDNDDEANRTVFVDPPWRSADCVEPYCATRVLNECMPELKREYPRLKIVSQDYDAPWVDENLPKQLDLDEVVGHYARADVFVVSHSETLGLPQIEAQLCGVKVVTTNIMSQDAAIIGGNDVRELWTFDGGNANFMAAMRRALKPYDKRRLASIATRCFSDKLAADNIRANLWSV